MKSGVTIALMLLIHTFLFAQDSLRRSHRNIHFGLFTTASYPFALNGNNISTNLGNVAFKGQLNPGIGLGIRYQQDSSEFALVTAGVQFLAYTASTSNIIFDNGNEYKIVNNYSMSITNVALEASYHKRISKFGQFGYLSFETGAGVHLLNWAGALYSADTAIGPYTITRQLESYRNYYVMPSAQIGLDVTVRPPAHNMQYIIGLQSQLYIAKFAEVRYDIQYTSPNNTLNYYFHWSPVILTPKLFMMVVF
jgi:hypothetical protein